MECSLSVWTSRKVLFVVASSATFTSMDSTTLVGPVFAYCDGMRCHVLCLQYGIPVWQHHDQSTTATHRNHCLMTSDVEVNTKQTIYEITYGRGAWYVLCLIHAFHFDYIHNLTINYCEVKYQIDGLDTFQGVNFMI